MNLKQLSDSGFNIVVSPTPIVTMPEQEAARQRLERSRKTILWGWIISMIGIVLYCLVMSSGDQQADLPSALAARGGVGWLAFIVIIIGVGVWCTGCVGFVKESELATPDSDDK